MIITNLLNGNLLQIYYGKLSCTQSNVIGWRIAKQIDIHVNLNFHAIEAEHLILSSISSSSRAAESVIRNIAAGNVLTHLCHVDIVLVGN